MGKVFQYGDRFFEICIDKKRDGTERERIQQIIVPTKRDMERYVLIENADDIWRGMIETKSKE